MGEFHTVAGGFSAVPLAVKALFAAPLAALLAGFFVLRPLKPEWTHWPILASCAAVCASAAALAARVYSGWGIDVPVATWMAAADWGISFGVRIDGLSAAVLSMVSLVGALIHVYAAGYMRGDPGFSRFFLLFHLFYLAMIGLLVSNSYAQLYLFWELVGAASYLLIGYWHHKPSARSAALQAFLTNRVGDFGLMVAVFILMAVPVLRPGGTRFALLFPLLPAADAGLVALSGLLIFWAACAKSAQFPLYFWLPDAMEGPTPVSALMHAATMVTAGIFLLARSWPLIAAIGGLPDLLGWVGAATAICAAALAGTRTDLKRILAYSTVSHLGLMAFALGLGEVGASIFHLVTHGFFKAVLFLCAGNIAHALGQPTASVTDTGGLAKKMPITFACFVVAALSLAGIFPFAGFYSKDAILGAALRAGPAAAAAGVLIGVLSAFYIFRMLFLVFLGPRSEQKRPAAVHEAEAIMAVPLVFLALGALGAGWLAPGFTALINSGWPTAHPVAAAPHLSLWVAAAGSAAAAAGAGAAWHLTMTWPGWDWEWRRRFPAFEAFCQGDFGWRAAVGLAAGAARGAAGLGRSLDDDVVDGAVESSGRLARAGSEAGGLLAAGSLNEYVWWMAAAAAALLLAVLR